MSLVKAVSLVLGPWSLILLVIVFYALHFTFYVLRFTFFALRFMYFTAE